MSAKDQGKKRVDAYISDAPDFARPILNHLRNLVHAACPDVEETMKWSRPHFVYKGLLCGMSAFRHHCAFGFWLGERVLGGKAAAAAEEIGGMGHFGRITSMADLPGDAALIALIKKAAALNDAGAKRPVPARTAGDRKLVIPDYLMTALKKNRKALSAFEGFSYSHKKEYVEWITEAKREETREKRIKTMMGWLGEGKPRNWKYAKC